eukprot:1161469-Pelagomonas_calceolata.AAC.40
MTSLLKAEEPGLHINEWPVTKKGHSGQKGHTKQQEELWSRTELRTKHGLHATGLTVELYPANMDAHIWAGNQNALRDIQEPKNVQEALSATNLED